MSEFAATDLILRTDFNDLVSRKDRRLDRHRDTASFRLNDVAVTIAFTPGEARGVEEIVGAIAAARNRLYVASVVMSSGPILAASEAIDRGLPVGGFMTVPRWTRFERQWKAANVGADKVNTWQKWRGIWLRKNSIPYDRQNQSQPHNFMHISCSRRRDCRDGKL